MSGARILVIDDEPQIHRFLGPALEASGFAVETALTAREGLRLAASRAPEVILLDLGLPDMDGQVVLRQLRAFSAVPLLVLSARDREAEKIAALDAGADDYVEKPFAVGELLARIRAALRHARAREQVPEIWRAAGVAIDFARRRVTLDGVRLALSPREYDLLSLLARNVDRVMTHRQLLTAVWGAAHVDDVQYLRVYIGQLRHKLGAAAGLLTTEAGIGYRLIGDGL
jgi:two-component system KDP operon response regulator KdpE